MAAAIVWLMLASGDAGPAPPPHEPFQQRGYYLTFMRMPTYDLAGWRQIIDDIHDDRGNLLLLWMGGAFRSRKFPITWQYNADHLNVQHDFARELIGYAHTRGIRVLLGFTPFGYDGVNRYPLEHPELKAIGRDGKPVDRFGIGCCGYNLCPSQPESQRFMLEYVREMFFDFYPNADGLMIESSDYAICHCPDCGARFFENEYRFIRRISDEVWDAKPDAMIVVYPHSFSGAEVPGFGVRAARLPFDPRWTLFFTPHSAHLDATLIRQARHSLWWDSSPALRRPQEIQQGALRARAAGVTGYVPSLESFSFIPTEAEEGQAWLRGRRLIPFGFGWLDEGQSPYDELPLRVNRIAYREFSAEPDLDFAEFRERLGEEVFGTAATPQLVSDLLELQAVFAQERSWCQASPVVCPDRVRAMKEQGTLTAAQQDVYRAALARLRTIRDRHREPASEGERQLREIVDWVLSQWTPENLVLLEQPTADPG